MYDPHHRTLVYTSHEGTTHLYGPGFFSPIGDLNFIANYRNQVNIWTSSNSGASWQQATPISFIGSSATGNERRGRDSNPRWSLTPILA